MAAETLRDIIRHGAEAYGEQTAFRYKVKESKAAIKAAIEAKGVENVGEILSEYPAKIAASQLPVYRQAVKTCHNTPC